jgi:beta-carotene hydroxylase
VEGRGEVRLREPAQHVGERAISVLAHPRDLACVVFHVATLLLYALAFGIHLSADRFGLDSGLELLAFDLGAALALGWCSGIEVGVNFHNHVHRRIFTRAGWNRWFERTWTVSGGWPAFLWKYAHVNVHHRRLASGSDWTLPRKGTDGRREGFFSFCLGHWPWRYAREMWCELRSPSVSPATRRRAARETAIFALLFVAPFSIDVEAALWLWLLPAWIANVLVMGPGMVAQHADCKVEGGQGSLAHSNTFRSRLFNALMFNIGFHAEHHTYPHVHWSELPRLHEELSAELQRDRVHTVPFGYYRAGYLLSRAALGSERCAREWRGDS